MERKNFASLSTFLIARSRFVTFWREGHRQAARDFRIGWICSGFWLLVFCWIFGLILALTTICIISEDYFNNYNVACLPDGSFAVDASKFRFWSISGFFQITLGAGNMNFTQVKIIDVVWDILVGRGGQAVLALISWRVFANYVTTSMEVMPVTLRTYRTVFLPNGSLITAIPRTIRDFTLRHGLQSKIAMCFMVTTMTFILAFPSFASAMTGYNGNVTAFVNATDNNYVPFKSFSFVFCVIQDGWRINQGGNFLVTDRTPSDVKEHGFYGISNEFLTFMGVELQPPTLNITALYLPFTRSEMSTPYIEFFDLYNTSWMRW
ncbi:hypothetical protein EJ02DRAFT_492288 [Clathrospora elynae]|uniref:Uncharacterized protein n=1 Tax=Clathrospora elynae TaxID=706981 RepID=A0A6A5S4K8_9PLEO|nr:hypothetical protein EJ02DRAFT_492288 [Clathrospora elynae]